MYNFPKLGAFISSNLGASDISKSYARKVYGDAENVIQYKGRIFFVISVTWDDTGLFMDQDDAHIIGKVVFEMPQDTSNAGKIHRAYTWGNDAITHPDYNSGVKVIKGAIAGFVKDLD